MTSHAQQNPVGIDAADAAHGARFALVSAGRRLAAGLTRAVRSTVQRFDAAIGPARAPRMWPSDDAAERNPFRILGCSALTSLDSALNAAHELDGHVRAGRCVRVRGDGLRCRKITSGELERAIGRVVSSDADRWYWFWDTRCDGSPRGECSDPVWLHDALLAARLDARSDGGRRLRELLGRRSVEVALAIGFAARLPNRMPPDEPHAFVRWCAAPLWALCLDDLEAGRCDDALEQLNVLHRAGAHEIPEWFRAAIHDGFGWFVRDCATVQELVRRREAREGV